MNLVSRLFTALWLLLLAACQITSLPETRSSPTDAARARTLAAVTLSPTAPSTFDYNSVPLIPRRTLFSLVDKTRVLISRDGTRLSYLAPHNGALNVWIAPLEDPAAAVAVTNERSGFRLYYWAMTNSHIIYLKDSDGDENFQVFATNLTSRATKPLTSNKNARASVQRISEKFPNEILLSYNDRDPRHFDLYRLNIESGERTLVLLNNEGWAGFVVDDEFNVRFVTRTTTDGGREYLRRNSSGGWSSFLNVGLEDQSTTYAVGLDKSGSVLWLVDSRGRNTGVMTALNVDTGAQRLVAQDGRADVDDYLLHPATREVQAVAFNYERKRWTILDPALAADFAYLQSLSDGDLEIVSRSLDDRRWIVALDVDISPLSYYYYDRDKNRAQFLFSNRKALETLELAKMHPVLIPARDGLKLVSYLTLPVRATGGNPARLVQPLGLVLIVHGGPWARDEWGLNLEHQWLANRGYAVLSVNYRGSTGFGKVFLNAGNLEWAGKMHDDLIDAVNWAIRERITTPDKVCIMGASYGGYATLVGLTFTPDQFACGVDLVGPSSLITLLNNPPPYWSTTADVRKQRVGDHTTEEGRAFLQSRSPLTYVERIKRPLLIGQGSNDPRVKQIEADQIVRAMQAKNIPVTYLLYPDEGHGFRSAANSRSFNAVTEAFFAMVLGGRVEPFGTDFSGSSMTVPVGAELIPGLADALKKK